MHDDFNGAVIGKEMMPELISMANLAINRCREYYLIKVMKAIEPFKKSKKWSNKILGMDAMEALRYLGEKEASSSFFKMDSVNWVLDQVSDGEQFIRELEEFKNFINQAILMDAKEVLISQNQMWKLLNSYEKE